MANALKRLSPQEFPPLLREIPDAPAHIYVEGTLPDHDSVWLAVVGSRSCTSYGKQVVSHLIESLAGEDVVIVSGLAFGIDALAHEAAMRAGLKTVAVPGSGLSQSVLYPRAHVHLAGRILQSGGALLSELEPDERAADWTFPKRNRIMAGLSCATLIIEAKERSGSLITARLATEYNRDLLVVPGSIFSDESRGVHQFLKLGATPVTSSEDLRKALGLPEQKTVAQLDLSSSEKEVFAVLNEPIPRDELLRALDMPISEAQVLLSTMEIKGLIIEELGVVRMAQ